VEHLASAGEDCSQRDLDGRGSRLRLCLRSYTRQVVLARADVPAEDTEEVLWEDSC